MNLTFVGKAYHGWQSQLDNSAIQDFMEKALQTMLRHPVKVIGASRTDSGVHAENFPCTFRTSVPFDQIQWMRSLAALVPKDISVRSITKAPKDFHPIRNSIGKVYRYRLWRSSVRHPFIDPFVWQIPVGTDCSSMAEVASQFVGTHDFTSFCASGSSAKTFTRTINEVVVRDSGALIDLWFSGEGFLKQMVRTMAGTIVAKAQGTITASIEDILTAADRTQAGPTAPAQGLSLVKVFFDKRQPLETLIQEASQGFSLSVL
jgi:tRNA pseudouridine38-40 synthase